VDAVGGAIGQLLPFGVASGPTGLAYDPTTECVYWADVHARTINRYSLRNNINTVIHRDPSHTGKYQQFISTYKYQRSYSFRTDFTDLNLYCIKGALALVVLVSFSGYVC